jgi:hypothetical protein
MKKQPLLVNKEKREERDRESVKTEENPTKPIKSS